MSSHTKKNLREVENQAPKFDMPAEMDARFARSALEGETLGLTLMKLAPNFRIPFRPQARRARGGLRRRSRVGADQGRGRDRRASRMGRDQVREGHDAKR